MTTPSRPAERYGDRTPRRSWVIVAVGLALIAVVAAVVFIARASDAQIRATAIRWDAPADDTMTVEVEVVRRPDSVVHCDVVAVDVRQFVVGQTELVVPASAERRVVVAIEVPLQGDAVAAVVRGCSPDR